MTAVAAEPVSEPRTRLGVLAVPATAGVLAAVITRLPHLGDLTLFDVDVYITLGQQWWHGDIPYRDLFDNKGPFLFELYAALALVLPRSLLALYVFGLAAFVLSVLQLTGLASRHLGRAGTWCAAVVYGIGASAIAFQGPEPNSDQLAMLGVVAAIDFADRGGRKWAVASGVALALAAGIKLSFLLVAPILLVMLGRRAASWVALGAGFGVTTALTLVPFALTGTLGDLRFVLFDYTDGYLHAGFDAVRDLDWAGRIDWAITFPGVQLLLTGLVLGFAAWRDPRTRRIALLGAAWLLATWLISRSTGRSYPHYFVGTVPPLALLTGAGVDAVGRRGHGPAVAALVVAAACMPLAIENYRAALRIPSATRYMDMDLQPLAAARRAARLVHDITGPQDSVFVATGGGSTNGGTFIYWLADRRPAYRIFYPADAVPQRYDEVSAALAKDPPDVLVWIPGTPKAPYEAAIARGKLRVVARYPGNSGHGLEVYARPGLG